MYYDEELKTNVAEEGDEGFKSGPPKDFQSAVEQRVQETGCSEGNAIRFCVGKYPGLHQGFLKEQREKAEVAAQRAQAAERVGEYPELHKKFLEGQKKE